MKKYNVGIIGYGWVAGAHIAAINATGRAQVTGVCSSRPLDSAKLSAQHGSPITAYRDLKTMLANPDIHVVSICSYPYDHAKQAIAAARAGKHLIIEKPLALSLKEVHAMQKAAQQAKVKTCVCFECRFSSQFLAIKAAIDRGLLGKIHYGEVDYYHGIGPWYGQFRWNTKRKRRRQQFVVRGLPRARCAAAVHGRRGRRGEQLRDQFQKQDVRQIRISRPPASPF